MVPRADAEVGHRPPAHPRGLLHPQTQRITRHHTHCTGAVAGPAPGGRRGRSPPWRNVIGTPPQPRLNTCRTGSPSVSSPTTTMPPATRGDAAHCPCSGHHPRAPSGGGNPPRRRGAHVPVAPGRRGTHAGPWHTPPRHPGRRGRHRKRPHSAGGVLRDRERRHRGMVTRPRTHHIPHHGTRVTPLARDHRTTADRDRHGRRPTGIGRQVGTRVRLPARWAAQAHPHQSRPRAGPHHGRIPHRGAPPLWGLGLHVHPPPRSSRSPQDALNRQKGYTLWWHQPAPEGGLQPPADQPGIGSDLTAVAQAVAAMAK